MIAKPGPGRVGMRIRCSPRVLMERGQRLKGTDAKHTTGEVSGSGGLAWSFWVAGGWAGRKEGPEIGVHGSKAMEVGSGARGLTGHQEWAEPQCQPGLFCSHPLSRVACHLCILPESHLECFRRRLSLSLWAAQTHPYPRALLLAFPSSPCPSSLPPPTSEAPLARGRAEEVPRLKFP